MASEPIHKSGGAVALIHQSALQLVEYTFTSSIVHGFAFVDKMSVTKGHLIRLVLFQFLSLPYWHQFKGAISPEVGDLIFSGLLPMLSKVWASNRP